MLVSYYFILGNSIFILLGTRYLYVMLLKCFSSKLYIYISTHTHTHTEEVRTDEDIDWQNRQQCKAPCTLSVKLSDFTVWRLTWRKNRVNCAVLTGNIAGLRTVFSSRLSRGELRSSLRESHRFLNLPADTTMVSSQVTSVSSNSFSWWASHDIFLFKCHLLLHILRFIFFLSDNITTDVASKEQTTALFLSITVTRTRRHTELTKNWQTWWETCAMPENIQFSFSYSFFYTVKLHSLT